MDTKLECEVDVEGTVDMMALGEEIRRGNRYVVVLQPTFRRKHEATPKAVDTRTLPVLHWFFE
jgi:hypothetical protein